jgi:serine O-acetyltransferase
VHPLTHGRPLDESNMLTRLSRRQLASKGRVQLFSNPLGRCACSTARREAPALNSREYPVDASPDAVWEQIWDEAAHHFKTQNWKTGDLQEFGVDKYLHDTVLNYKTLTCGLSHNIGGKLQANGAGDKSLDFISILRSGFQADPGITQAVAHDICRFTVVDPATKGLLGVFLFFKGVQAIACARVAHHYWTERGEAGKLIARLLQAEMSDTYGVDIHPGCKLGKGITIDHATGVVIGETSVIGDNVYLMHDVTLGATGTEPGFDRHPKIGNGCFLGAKCTVLGNIEVGEGATIAAAAVVNKPVPPGYTAVGVPAKVIAPREERRIGDSFSSKVDIRRAK